MVLDVFKGRVVWQFIQQVFYVLFGGAHKSSPDEDTITESARHKKVIGLASALKVIRIHFGKLDSTKMSVIVARDA
jgi:hypothetical protein